ncbi:HNH endonuclease [Variovorax sp. CF079]|uniref:HNH endonuclease n=1 Tax=Variovorax sp. CF079 TaxID=1882774 RepID=UPI00087EF83F|nr:HNH endonuclease [Variovorax sp. CF079]SDC45274.1 HNH endonuclease [Variovorax sp. CF079]
MNAKRQEQGKSGRRTSKQARIDKRFALVDTVGELRYPYKVAEGGSTYSGFVVGPDRLGDRTSLDDLEDVVRSVVLQGRRLRVTVDPMTEGKGSNLLCLHAGREIQGYVLAEELHHLVSGADIAPMGIPAAYPRPSAQPDASHFAVWGSVGITDLHRLISTSGLPDPYLYLSRSANWSTVESERKKRPSDLPPIPFFLVEDRAPTLATWVARIATVRRSSGPSALVELQDFARLLEPVGREQFRNFHTGKPLNGAVSTDMPCTMSPKARAALAQRLPVYAFEDETLSSDAAQAEVDLRADPQAASVPETTRKVLANARVGQGSYRQRMMELWNSKCAVTRCAIKEVLVASHARPWSESTNFQRLDEYNGLLLAASVDKLFDAGLISFDDNGLLLASQTLSDHDLASVGLTRSSRIQVMPRHLDYLQAHRVRHSLPADLTGRAVDSSAEADGNTCRSTSL